MRGLLAAVAAVSGLAATPLPFACDIGDSGLLTVAPDLTYTVTVGAPDNVVPLLQGGSVAVHAAGRSYTPSTGLVLDAASIVADAGSDALLGDFTALSANYSTSDGAITAVTVTFRCYSVGLLVFETSFPVGAVNVTTEPAATIARASAQRLRVPGAQSGEFNASATPSTSFPSFVYTDTPIATMSVGYIEWSGRFSNDETSYGNSMRDFIGGQTGGPLALFNRTAYVPGSPAAVNLPSLVLAPFDQFPHTILAVNPDPAGGASPPLRLLAGVQGYVVDLPTGYTVKVSLAQHDHGPTAAMQRWGRLLRRAHQTKRLGDPTAVAGTFGAPLRRPVPPGYNADSGLIDPLSHWLSYWTDNGGYYYGNYWPAFYNPNNNTAQDVLQRLRTYHAAIGMPARSYQLDPWWLPNDPAGTGAVNFTAGSVFQNDASSLVALQTPWTLYTWFWALQPLSKMSGFDIVTSLPAQQSWFPGVIGRVAVDEVAAFFDVVMDRIVGWGGNAFEIDFVDFTTLLFADTRNNTAAADVFWQGMNAAAMRTNISMQLCMMLPQNALASVQLPAFTNARASEDDFPTNDGRWDIGVSAMLYGAVDLRAFYDTFWTTAAQPAWDNPYGNEVEAFPEVSAIISTLSGPVGPGDGVGFANMTLINATCAADGMLLRPSVPAYAVDATYLSIFNGAGFIAPSYIPMTATAAATPRAGTIDAPTPWPWLMVLAVDVSQSLFFTPYDLYPVPALTAPPISGISVAHYVAVRWSPGSAAVAAACATGQPASTCASLFDANNPITVYTGGENPDLSKPHELLALAPLFSNGFALVGELAKIVRVSPDRFAYVNATAGGLQTVLKGAAGEVVNVTVLQGAAANGDGTLAGVACTWTFTLPSATVAVAVGGGGGVEHVPRAMALVTWEAEAGASCAPPAVQAVTPRQLAQWRAEAGGSQMSIV